MKNIREILIKSKNFLFRLLPDTYFAKLYFRRNYSLRFNPYNVDTFNEKLWWLHLYNRDPLTTLCTDKIAVREYVQKCGLGEILNEVYAVFRTPEEIDLSILPDEFFIKTNHLSNGNLWVRNKNEINLEEIKKNLTRYMKRNYYWNSREWNYKNINPKVFCEKLIVDRNSEAGLIDYRFFCFNGKAHFLCVDIDTCSADGSHYSGAKRNVYDLDFRKTNIKLRRPNFDDSNISKPQNFDLMIQYAEILSNPFVACRVDFYNIDGKIVFGEITFHQGGAHDITPTEYQKKWGDLIDLKSSKLVLSKWNKLRFRKITSKS